MLKSCRKGENHHQNNRTDLTLLLIEMTGSSRVQIRFTIRTLLLLWDKEKSVMWVDRVHLTVGHQHLVGKCFGLCAHL